MSSHLPSALADESARRIIARALDYRSALGHARVDHWGRHQRVASARHDNAIIDAIALTEVFTSERLLQSTPTVRDTDVLNWQAREKAWLTHANVTLSDATTWLQVRGYVEVRNALQHGIGRLTELQLGPKRRAETLEWIGATGCQLDGDLVRATAHDAEACFDACLAFIRWLDQQVP